MAFTKVTPAELAAGEAEVRQLEQLEAAETERLKELKASDPKLRIRLAQARKAMAIVAVQTAEKAIEDCKLKAPSNGTLLRIQTSVGEAVTPGGYQPPIIFRPAGPLVVRAELEQEFLGRVKEGMKANIKDETRPDSPTWTGTLTKISGWVARRRSIVLEPGELNDVRTVECLVTLDPKQESLLVGQRVRVRFLRGN
jgi:multidrug resistance efflux pump